MTSEDIALISRETGLDLPQHYIDIVTNYPPQLANTEAPDFGLLDDAQIIIEENLSVRRDGYFGEAWPNNYFIIGHNGCGDYYVTLLDSSDFSVGFSDHQKMACDPFANCLQDFVDKLLREQGDA